MKLCLMLITLLLSAGQLVAEKMGTRKASAAGQSSSSVADATGAPTGGYVVGNFGISAQISEENGPQAWIKVNPPTLGVWLQNFAQGELWIRKEGEGGKRLRLRMVRVSRLYPRYDGVFESENHVRMEVRAFAPLGLDSKNGFLPTLIFEVQVKSPEPWSGVVGYTMTQAKGTPDSDDDPADWPADSREIHAKGMSGLIRGPAILGLASDSAEDIQLNGANTKLSVAMPVTVDSGRAKTLAFIVGAFDRKGRYATAMRSGDALLRRVASRIDTLRQHMLAFEASLPRTGDSRIDAYLRWYISAGILLTKGDADGNVLTMGYRELNQRDSFWTSFIHLVFWKDLERTMILESIRGQTAEGRIPTTILPLIDRGDEIDSSEYFILRVARFYRWYCDDDLLRQVWPAIQRAIEYLSSRDTEKVGAPLQISYWADWKDVPAVQGRKYAPHFALLWLAALRQAADLAEARSDKESSAKYAGLADRAQAFINKPFDEGGLWNGSAYADRWDDSRRPAYTMEDQVVGAYFNVIPEDKLQNIYHQLEASETPWGVRETYPYISGWSQETGGAPGNYHDGGIWPYLNFVDAAGRYRNNQAEHAEKIIREVGNADLDKNEDDRPGEYLNGDSGADGGFPIQGWDAALFGAIYFGGFGLDRTSRANITIHVHLPVRDFSTPIVLPECTGTLSRHAKQLYWAEDHDACREKGIKVSVEQNP
jgi:hypothetical protein